MTQSFRQLSREEAKALWDKIYAEGIQPNLEAIQRIHRAGDIACLVFDLHETSLPMARHLGYDGKNPVFRMSNAKRKPFARKMESVGDPITARWLERKNSPRIFLMVHMGTFLLNIKDGELVVEPGSLSDPRDAPLAEASLARFRSTN